MTKLFFYVLKLGFPLIFGITRQMLMKKKTRRYFIYGGVTMNDNGNKNNTTLGNCFDLSLDELLSTLVKKFTKRASVRKIKRAVKVLNASNLYDLTLMNCMTDSTRERLFIELSRMNNRQGGAL